MTRTDEIARFDGLSRRKLLRASAVGIGTVGLAGCTGAGESPDSDAQSTAAETSGDAPAHHLDLETLAADTEVGTLQAERVENSYVGSIDEGQAIGIAFLDDVGAGDTQNLDDGIVVHLYDRQRLAIMLGEVDSEGAAMLESEEDSDFDATVELTLENDAVTGTVTFDGEASTPFTVDAATGIAGVYWARGTDEEPDVRGDWVVLSDVSQWGCVCVPPFSSPCCTLGL